MVYTFLEVVACWTLITYIFHRWMCLIYLQGQTALDSDMFHLCFFLSLASLCQCCVTSDFALVLRAFMPPLFRDPHPTCVGCRGVKCTADVTCDICKDWSVMQLEAFLKRRHYSEHHKKRPSLCVSDPSALHLGFFRSRTPCASPSVTPPPPPF